MSRGTKSFWRSACDSGEEVQWAFLEWGLLYSGYCNSGSFDIMILLNENEVKYARDNYNPGSIYYPNHEFMSKNEVYDEWDHLDSEFQERIIWSIYNEFGYVYALIYVIKNKIRINDFGGTLLYKRLVQDMHIVNAVIQGYSDMTEIHNKTSWDRRGNEQDYFEGHKQEIITFITNEQVIARGTMKREREARARACWAKVREENNKNKFKERSVKILGKVFKIKSALSSS